MKAVAAGQQLGEVADHLIGHFVDQARRAGASWTEIGQSMGVTKQAAQKRFVPRVDAAEVLQESGQMSKFTLKARRVVVLAQTLARESGHPQVGTEHVLLGLLDVRDALAARAIVAQDVDIDTVRRAAHDALPPPGNGGSEHLPFTKGARRLLQLRCEMR